jgi:hypothetical protein
VSEHALDHRHLDDREHLLRRRQREWAEPGALAAYEDDGPHGADVVVLGTVVAVVTVVDAVLSVGADVAVVPGAVVDEVSPPTTVVGVVGATSLR